MHKQIIYSPQFTATTLLFEARHGNIRPIGINMHVICVAIDSY